MVSRPQNRLRFYPDSTVGPFRLLPFTFCLLPFAFCLLPFTFVFMILLDGSSLTIEQLLAIADGGEPVALSPDAAARVRASRAVVDRKAHGPEPAYGINTGFGSFAEVAIAPDALETLQVNLLRSHAAGLGDPLPVRAVRATMALRANVLAKGFSGIREQTLEALIALLNSGVHPVVPSRGSVGASGDLAPLAHLALVLIGAGEAFDTPP